MPSPRSLLRPLLVLLVVYGLLSVPLPGLGRAFASGYARVAEAAMAQVLPFEGTTFRSSVPGDGSSEWDLLIRLPRDPDSMTVHGVRVHLRRICYVPLAFFTALAMAFPARPSRRWLAIAGGLGTMAVLQVAALCSVFTTRGGLDLGLVLNVLVAIISRALVGAPGMSFAIPALLWVLLGAPHLPPVGPEAQKV